MAYRNDRLIELLKEWKGDKFNSTLDNYYFGHPTEKLLDVYCSEPYIEYHWKIDGDFRNLTNEELSELVFDAIVNHKLISLNKTEYNYD